MKNILMTLTTVCLLMMAHSAIGQNYGKFATDLGVRYGLLTGDYKGGGVGFFLEPQVMIKDKIGLSLRLGIDLLSGQFKDDPGFIGGGTDILSSYLVYGNYYLKNSGNKRGFVSLGLGLADQGGFSIESTSGNPIGIDINTGPTFGLSPRAGFDLGVLKISADYNLFLREGSKNYFGMNLSLNFGGKYKG